MVDDNDVTGAFEEYLEERLEESRISRRSLLRRGVLAGAGLGALPMLLSQVGPAMAASGRVESGSALATLIAAAKKEGSINTITLPPTWANYGEIMKTFQSTFKLKLNNSIPDGTSAQENTALTSLKGSKRAPDVVDVGPSFAQIGKTSKIYLPYKDSTWSTIPANLKDASGDWVGDYWGVISFGINTDVAKTAPADWADLKDPEVQEHGRARRRPAPGRRGLLGGLRRIARERRLARRHRARHPVLRRPQDGRQLHHDAGHLGHQGERPDADRVRLGLPAARRSRRAEGQGQHHRGRADERRLSAATTARPSTSTRRTRTRRKLWQEFLYSDAGQLLFLKGYTHPARFQDMSKRGVVPKSLIAKLPPAQDYKTVKFADRRPDHQGDRRARGGLGPEGPGAVALSATVAERVESDRRAGPARPARRAVPLAWLGALPFFLYAALFLLFPAGDVLVGRVPQRRRRLDDRQHPICSSTRSTCTRSRTRSSSASTPRSSAACSAASMCYAALHPAAPRWMRTGRDGVRGRRLAVRRRAARLLLHLEHRHGRRRDAVPEGLLRASTCTPTTSRSSGSGASSSPTSISRSRSCCS